jgi:hypothetical protein
MELAEMKYFAHESSEGTQRTSLSGAQQKALDRRFERSVRAYQKQLAKLEGRISRQAWNFFAFGFGGWGLHDARLLAFSVGDGLDNPGDGRERLDVNKQKVRARILILNRKQTLLYSFACTDIRTAVFNYPVQDTRWDSRRVKHLLTYELTAVNKHYMSLEFLFSSNATLLVEFGRLKFRRRRISRG